MGKRRRASTRETMGDRLAAVMERQGWSYRTLGQYLGKSHSTIGNWCNGGAIPDDALEELAEALGTNPAWLRYGEDAVATGIDVRLLRKVIAAVEAYLTRQRLDPSPAKRARLITLVYDSATREGSAALEQMVDGLVQDAL